MTPKIVVLKHSLHNMEVLSTVPKFQKSRSSLCLPCHCVLVESAADIFQLMRQLPCTNLLKMIWKWYIIHRLDTTCWCIKIIDGQASLGAENQSKIAVATKIGMKWTFFIYISSTINAFSLCYIIFVHQNNYIIKPFQKQDEFSYVQRLEREANF